MGNSGSYTAKADLLPELSVFTKWDDEQMKLFINRGLKEMPETYALRRHEFNYLLGGDENISFKEARTLFEQVFDSDRNGLIDKMEVMCIVSLCSKISSENKVNFFFDLFNFNSKGYLNENELILLIKTVTRGVYKIDQKFLPPSDKEVKDLVKEALLQCKFTPGNIRRNELIQFVLNNVDVSSYLECWRGHAAQVLLPNNTQWRDYSFPANELSIQPTNMSYYSYNTPQYNISKVLPPDYFTKWFRADRIAWFKVKHVADILKKNDPNINVKEFISQDMQLFAHEIGFIKKYNNKKSYRGLGVLGSGSFQTRFLSSNWLLNSLACLTNRPELFTKLFALTGQEAYGRYCVRAYEGGQWRSIYIDSRLPCDPLGELLFTRSSCITEFWPSLLEKAIAKYLGSYSQIPEMGLRHDSIEFGLRLLTGGHVVRYHADDFGWKSSASDLNFNEENGVKWIQQILAEGGSVAFGRSYSMLYKKNKKPKGMMKIKKKMIVNMLKSRTTQNKQNQNLNNLQFEEEDDDHAIDLSSIPPVGKAFTVLTIQEGVQGFIFFTLRDSWDIIGDVNKEIDEVTGHCNTFQVRVEDIPVLYDTLYVVRFPDTLRSNPKEYGLQPWLTDIKCAPTRGPDSPATFLLTINEPVNNSVNRKINKFKRQGSLNQQKQINDLLTKMDGHYVDDVLEGLSVKSKFDFTRDFQHKKSALIDTESNQKSDLISSNSTVPEDLVDVSLTISSSCDWSYGGSPQVGAKIRARIVARPTTRQAIISRDNRLKEKRKKEIALLKKRLTSQANANLNQSEISTNIDEESHELPSRANYSKVLESPINPSRDFSHYVDLTFTSSRQWISQYFFLLPGEYEIYLDISYDQPYLQVKLNSLPKDLSESPWIDKNLKDYVFAMRNRTGLHPFDRYIPDLDELGYNSSLIDSQVSDPNSPNPISPNLNSPNPISQVDKQRKFSDNSVELFEKNLFPSLGASTKEIISNDTIKSESLGLNRDEVKLKVENLVWLECTSIESISLKSIDFSTSILGKAVAETLTSNNPDINQPLMTINEELSQLSMPSSLLPIFPKNFDKEKLEKLNTFFLYEPQEVVSSRGLYNTISNLQTEIQNIGEEFLSLAVSVKEKKKQQIKSKFNASAHKKQ